MGSQGLHPRSLFLAERVAGVASSVLVLGGEGRVICTLAATNGSGEGGIRTHGDHKGHNGFRDRPDRPLRHLSDFARPLYNNSPWLFRSSISVVIMGLLV
jgi:hypothetical protein